MVRRECMLPTNWSCQCFRVDVYSAQRFIIMSKYDELSHVFFLCTRPIFVVYQKVSSNHSNKHWLNFIKSSDVSKFAKHFATNFIRIVRARSSMGILSVCNDDLWLSVWNSLCCLDVVYKSGLHFCEANNFNVVTSDCFTFDESVFSSATTLFQLASVKIFLINIFIFITVDFLWRFHELTWMCVSSHDVTFYFLWNKCIRLFIHVKCFLFSDAAGWRRCVIAQQHSNIIMRFQDRMRRDAHLVTSFFLSTLKSNKKCAHVVDLLHSL